MAEVYDHQQRMNVSSAADVANHTSANYSRISLEISHGASLDYVTMGGSASGSGTAEHVRLDLSTKEAKRIFVREIKRSSGDDVVIGGWTKLIVNYLPAKVTEQEFRSLGSKYGRIADLKLIIGRGFGFLDYCSPDEAQAALIGLSGLQYEGKILHAQFMFDCGVRPRHMKTSVKIVIKRSVTEEPYCSLKLLKQMSVFGIVMSIHILERMDNSLLATVDYAVADAVGRALNFFNNGNHKIDHHVGISGVTKDKVSIVKDKLKGRVTSHSIGTPVFVGNLVPWMTMQFLSATFGSQWRILSIRLMCTGKENGGGYAFLNFADKGEAMEAVKEFNHRNYGTSVKPLYMTVSLKSNYF